MQKFTIKYVSKIAHEKCLSVSEDNRKKGWLIDKEKGRQAEAVCAACLAAEAANPMSMTPIKNIVSTKACITNTQAVDSCLSLQII